MVLYHWSCFFRLKPKTQLAKNCQQVKKKKKLYRSKGNDVFNCRRSNENRFSEVRFLNCSMFMGPKSWVELTPPRPGQLGGSGEDLIRLNSSELKNLWFVALALLMCTTEPQHSALYAWDNTSRILTPHHEFFLFFLLYRGPTEALYNDNHSVPVYSYI